MIKPRTQPERSVVVVDVVLVVFVYDHDFLRLSRDYGDRAILVVLWDHETGSCEVFPLLAP